MKKLLALLAFLVAGLSVRSQAQTYLVDLYHSDASKYTGSVSSGFGISGAVIAVGGSREETTPGPDNTPGSYPLGATAVLTLNAPSQGTVVNTGSNSTDPYRLTGAYLFTNNGGSAPADTFTLTVPAGSSISIAAIGSANANPGTLSVSDGVTMQSAAVTPASSTGTGAFTQVATFSNDSSTSYTLSFANTPGGTAEGDLAALLITIGSTFVTADSALTMGTPGSITYTAPGASSAIAQIASSANPGNLLWNLVPDPYGITAGSGSMNMTYSGQGSIESTVKLSGLSQGSVVAYPFIGYGADVFGYAINGQAPQFPAKLSTMSSLVFDTSFALSGTFTGDIDILFDEWLMPTATYSGGQSGAVEVEILPYYSFPGTLYGTFLKTFTVPVILNGTPATLTFQEYASAAGAGGGSLVLFYPAQGLMSGEVSFDAMAFLKEAATTAAVPSTWYVAGFDLGTEFGKSLNENFTFTVNKISIAQTLFSPPAVMPPLPIAPTNLTATPGNAQVSLAWTSSAAAASYNVQRATASGGPYALVGTSTNASFVDTGLTNLATYYYVVSSVNLAGTSGNSSQASAVPSATWAGNDGSRIPLADAYVRDGSYANTNFGTATDLLVKYVSTTNSGFVRQSYLRFNVAGLANATDVQVWLVPFSLGSESGSTAINYEYVPNDTWIESGTGGITWNNKPAGSGFTFATTTGGYSIGQPVKLDVTSLAQSQAASDGMLTIHAYSPIADSSGNEYVDFGSKENTAVYQPILVYVGATPLLDAWRFLYFGAYGNSGIAADTANPAGDGIPNLLKYGTGANPLVADSSPPAVLEMTTDGTRLTLTFNSIADPLLTYSVEATNDLSSGMWTTIWTSTGAGNVAGSVTVQDTALISNSPHRFLRLSVSR